MAKISLQAARETNAKRAQLRPLTAVFTGGTSGIGDYTIHTLAVHYGRTGQALRIYIVGRNGDAAASIISDCCKACPQGDFRFVKAHDLSLLRDVDDACNQLTESEQASAAQSDQPACIDLLIMCHADLHFGGRRDTKEGLDKSMSLLYYSRMRFVVNLIPLLRASKDPAHVISVFGAGLENSKDWQSDDMSLRGEGHYSMAKYRSHVVIMKTFFMEKLADQNAGKVAFTHVFPGLVITPAFVSSSHPVWFKIAWALMGPIAKRTIAVSPTEIGERVLFIASARYPPQESASPQIEKSNSSLEIARSTTGLRGGGAYSCKYGGETNDVEKTYESLRKQNVDQKVWDHTIAAFKDIEASRVFKG